MSKRDDIKKELEEQEDENYGTDWVDGAPDEFRSTKEMVKEVYGEDAKEDIEGNEPFSMAEEIEEDQKKRKATDDNDDEEEEENEGIIEAETGENIE